MLCAAGVPVKSVATHVWRSATCAHAGLAHHPVMTTTQPA